MKAGEQYEKQMLDMNTLQQIWNRNFVFYFVQLWSLSFFASLCFTCTYFLWQNEVGAALAEAGEYILQVFPMCFIKFVLYAIKNY
jgi:hypothetical protein